MTLRIGKIDSHGFTLIELMLTVSFVLLGMMLIQGSLLRSADMFGRYSSLMKTMIWMDQQISASKENLLYFNKQDAGDESGSVLLGGKSYDWSKSVRTDIVPALNSLQVSISWKESGKPVNVKSESYVYKKDKSQGG